MAIGDWFTRNDRDDTTPPGASPDYESPGRQPGPHQSGVLAESERTLDALDRRQAAADAAAATPPPPVVLPPARREAPSRVREEAPNDWHAETFIVQPGKAVQILGRDDDREDGVITNQTNVENAGGAGIPVFLFRSRGEAEAWARTDPAPQQGRFCVIPDGASREMSHTAPVWAAVRHDAATFVIVDVTIERYKGGRP